MRFSWIIIVLFLTACASSAQTTSHPTQEQGLAVQAVNAQQTSQSANAMATQAAVNLQNAQARIEQATAGARATVEAYNWQLKQTQDAMSVSVTQSAMTVQAQITQIAQGQEKERATATAEAIRRSMKEQADWESANQLIKGGLVLGAWATFATIVIVSGIVAHSFLYGISGALASMAEAKAHEAWARAHVAQIFIDGSNRWKVESDGTTRPLLIAGKVIDAQPINTREDETETHVKNENWRIALSRFVTHAGDKSFSFARLGPPTKNSKDGQGLDVVDRTDWDLLTDYMINNGWLHSKGEGSKTAWAIGWSKERFFSEVMHGDKPLPPFPLDRGVPNVRS